MPYTNAILNLLGIRKLCALALITLVSGCGAMPKLDTLETTYPVNRREQVIEQFNLPIPISISVGANLSGGTVNKPLDEKMAYSPGTPVIKGRVNRTIVGDDAMEELWIVPRNGREANESALLARVNEGGRRSCRGDFRLKSTKYFYGPEATLRFMGINSPAIEAKYRCPAQRLGVRDPDFSRVARLSSRYSDAKYFDISSFFVPQTSGRVATATAEVAKKLGMQIVRQGREPGALYVIAANNTTSFGKVAGEKLVVVIREVRGGSKITLMHMPYELTYHERGVSGAGTAQRGFPRDPQPKSRSAAYDEARFVAKLIALQSGA